MSKKIIGIGICMQLIIIATIAPGLSQSSRFPYPDENNTPMNAFSVEIVKPAKGYLYIKDQQKASLKILTLILGKITVEANVTGGSVQRVEFYLDDTLRHTDYGAPYTWAWDALSLFRHTLKAVAYDYNESSAEQSLPVRIFNLRLPSKQLTQDAAIQILRDEVIHPESLDHTVYAFTLGNTLQQGDRIAPWLPDPLPASIEFFPDLVYRESQKAEWFFWVDDAPRARFQHETRFVFIDANTGTVEVQNEQWWAVLNDNPLWNASEEYWNPDNWAYTNDNLSKPTLPYASQCIQPPETRTMMPSSRGENGAIVINGWSRGQTGEGDFHKDASGMGTFWGTYPGFDTAKVNPPNNNQSNIHNAFNSTGDNNDVVVYICAHGGVDASGEPYVSCGGQKVTEDELVGMANEHPNTTYKWVIDACHSGAFMASLKNLNNSAKIITACGPNECSYGDWDPANDPNPADQGGEFSSGLLEDLWEEWLNNPLIGIIDLLDKAYLSAVAKDACAKNGYTHPQLWERLDVIAPIIVITFPLNNSHVVDPMLPVFGVASDSLTGIVGWDYLWEWDIGSEYHNFTVAPPLHSLNFDFMIAPLFPGPNHITVGAMDAAGNYGTSSVVVFFMM